MDSLDFLRQTAGEWLPVARVAAIPNSFDDGLLSALLEDTPSSPGALQGLNAAGLLVPREREHFAVHPLFRKELLATWWEDLPAFRAKCKRGYDYMAPPPAQTGVETSVPVLQELTYLALGAGLPAGLELVDALYNSARSRHQLGQAEQLLSFLVPLGPALAPAELETLEYYRADLALAYYRLDEAEAGFGRIAAQGQSALHQAMALLGLGRVYLARHRWQPAFRTLQQAETALAGLRQPLYQAMARLTIGVTLDDLAERSGGLYRGDEETLDPLGRLERSSSAWLSAAVTALLQTRPLSELYFRFGLNPRSLLGRALTALYVGSNYQDWVITRLKVEAAQCLQAAAAAFESLGAFRELADARDQLVVLYHQLGHRRHARRLQEVLLADGNVQRSEYWQARIRLARGQIEAEARQWTRALEDLDAATPVLSSYADWERAGAAAQFGGQVRRHIGNRRGAAVPFRRAADYFQQANDLLRRTEALVAMSNASGTPIEESEELGFIDRFPGDLARRVKRGSPISVNGLTWICTLLVVLLVGLTAMDTEALVLFYRNGVQTSFSATDILILASIPFLPFLLIFGYRLIYVLVGGVVWAYRLPLQDIEWDPPEIVVLTSREISRQTAEQTTLAEIGWNELLGIISAERRLFGELIHLGSRLVAVTNDRVLPVEATTRFYKALKIRMLARRGAETQWLSADLDYVKSGWFVALVLVSLLIGGLTSPIRARPATCPPPQECPGQIVPIVVSTKFLMATFIFALLMPLVLSLRARLQRRRVERAERILRGAGTRYVAD